MKQEGITVWVWVEEEDEGMWRGLYLKPGEHVDLSYGGEHDEGWSRTEVCTGLSEDGTVVRQLICSEGADCDGRVSSTSRWHCLVEDIHKIKNAGEPPQPDWQKEYGSQRDYTAESMGY